jgi:F-type H+-transporting ATPase subunit alpha
LTEIHKQDQFVPYPVEEEVVALFAGVRGYLDNVEVTDVTRFEAQLLNEVREKESNLLDTIRKEKDLSQETEQKLTAFLDAFAKSFT